MDFAKGLPAAMAAGSCRSILLLSRREFTEACVALLSAACLRAEGGLLSAEAGEVLESAVRAVLPLEDPDFPAIPLATLVQRVQHLVPAAAGERAAWEEALRQFNGLSVFRSLLPTGSTRFVTLELSAQRAYLTHWSRSEVLEQRRFYRALRGLVMAATYSLEEMWRVIGYDGPFQRQPQ